MNRNCRPYKERHEIIIVVTLLAIFGSHSQMAPAAAGSVRIFEPGTSHLYTWTSTILLNEATEGGGKDVGYQITGLVTVSSVWADPQDHHNRLLQVEVKNPQLSIKSRQAPTPEGFVVHKSYLDNIHNSPFLVQWHNGKISNVYFSTKEDTSTTNLKRGITSLFQFQTHDTETKETDASGDCHVKYTMVDPFTLRKMKKECVAGPRVPFIKHPDHVLSTSVSSDRVAHYVLSRDLTAVESVATEESHDLRVILKQDAMASISATQQLTLKESQAARTVLTQETLDKAVNAFEKNQGIKVVRDSLVTKRYLPNCQKEECPSLPKLIKENREHLTSNGLGTSKSATVFVKLLAVARTASKEELTKAFKGTKNKEIMTQLCDLAGAVQTQESHEVIMKLINIDADEDLDNSERYLWALSVNSQPNQQIATDIFKLSQKPHPNEKISETLILTAASMVHRLTKLAGQEKSGLAVEVRDSVLSDLEACTEEKCKYKFLRALRNLKCPSTIPTLLKHALQGKRKASVEAMKALRSLDKEHWSDEVQEAAQRIYFQAGRKFDSSSRTLALDILLESEPKREILEEVILTLREKERAFEVKQYLLQRLRQHSEISGQFAAQVESIFADNKKTFSNYHDGAVRGLTTAFTRSISSNIQRNASLVSMQEVSSGLLKRGIVDVVVGTPGNSKSLFTLGLFAGGLGTFLSSSSDEDKADSNEIPEAESATAGMELSVLGTQLRPFVFFDGQGELMGHVWSGTASEKTPAYQAFVVTHDHLEYISLQNGLMLQLQLLGAVSFDLSGQIQMSLWNKNAHSLVEKNAGIFLQGKMQVDTSFVRSQVEFNLATEVKLHLLSDINFYSGVALCMQLSQPDAVIRHNIHKVERIPGSKHRLRKSTYKKVVVPGRTYALNQKNNEMCNAVFNDK